MPEEYVRFAHRQSCCPICKTPAIQIVGVASFNGDGVQADHYGYRFDNGQGVRAEHLTAENAPRVPEGRSVFIILRCVNGHEFRCVFENKENVTEYFEVILTSDLESQATELLADNEPPEH